MPVIHQVLLRLHLRVALQTSILHIEDYLVCKRKIMRTAQGIEHSGLRHCTGLALCMGHLMII